MPNLTVWAARRIKTFCSRRTSLCSRYALHGAAVLTLTACDPEESIQAVVAPDGEDGSLRTAIAEANGRSTASVRIQLAPGQYDLDRCGQEDDSNTAGDLDLTTGASVTLVAAAPGAVIRQTCSGERVLDTHGSGMLTLEGVTLTGGSVVSRQPGGSADGGGLRAAGDVTLTPSVVITSNSVTGAPGVAAIARGSATTGGVARGGGLFVAGALRGEGFTVSLNVAKGGAGQNAPAPDGVPAGGGAAEGGGAYVVGGVDVSAPVFDGNAARGGKGGDALYPGIGGHGYGGALRQSDANAPVVLRGPTLTHNQAVGGDSGGTPSTDAPLPLAPAGDARGGALATAGGLTVSQMRAQQNSAVGGSSGHRPLSAARSPTPPGKAYGGAIASEGAASLVSGSCEQNTAASGDTECSTQGCGGSPASGALGGGVWSSGDLVIQAAAFGHNVARAGTGPLASGVFVRGGAVASEGTLAVTGGRYDANFARGQGHTSARPRGHGAAGGAISGSARVTLSSRLAFTGNTADGRGGAVDAATLDAADVTASWNTAAGSGGGAFAVGGNASIKNSLIRDNVVETSQVEPGIATGGGGISVLGHLDLTNATVSGNVGSAALAINAGPFVRIFPDPFVGGGIRAGTLTANRVTISRNEANSVLSTLLPGSDLPNGGGGIAVTGLADLTNCMLEANQVASQPYSVAVNGQGAAIHGGPVRLHHVTLLENDGPSTLHITTLETRASVAIAPTGRAVCSTGVQTTSSGFNWFSDASCALAGREDQQTRPTLAWSSPSFGSSVSVRVPAAGSVLLDRIPAAECTLTIDARGALRPQGPGCDVGAAERGAADQ